jgi:hypothetical protein
MGDNIKTCNKNCDTACTDLKLRQKGGEKLYATNQAHENQCIGLNGEFCA